VDGHLVAVEVGVKRRTYQRDATGLPCPSIKVGSNAWMPRRCNVGARFSITGMLADDFFKNIPHDGCFSFDFFLAALIVLASPIFSRRSKMKGLNSSKAIFFRQTALMQLQLWAHHDN
jgi:hypothetical protein